MNEHANPSHDTYSAQAHKSPYKPLSTTMRLMLLGAASLAVLGSAALVAVGFAASEYLPESLVASIFGLCTFTMGVIALLGPIFGSYDLAKSLRPDESFNPFHGLIIWIGAMAVNFFVAFAMCMAVARIFAV